MKDQKKGIIKAMQSAATGGAPGEGELARINEHALRALTADEVFVFSLVLCDNEIDRDGERFDIPTLRALAPMFVGKSGIFDHNAKTENQTARIFACEQQCDPAKKTAAGEPYHALKARAYMLRCDKNSALIAEIEAGIKKEVSVGCAVRSVLCSACGCDVKRQPCDHRAGELLPDGSMCHRILSGALDAYEWSFVAVPAQAAAGVTKAKGNPYPTQKGEQEMQQILKKLGSEALSAQEGGRLRAHIDSLNELAAYGRAYREGLEDEVLCLAFAAKSGADCAVLKTAVHGMELTVLRELKKLLEQDGDNYLAQGSQLYRKCGDVRQSGNTEFRI